MYVDGSAIEAMNRMQRFLKSHDEALELFSFTPGYSDFRAYADKRGLAFDPEEGFIDRAAAIERAQQRKLAEVRAYIEQAARPALA